MLDAILCELEGVLADTAALRREALRASLAHEEIAVSERELADACAALPTPAAAAAALALRGESRDAVGLELIVLRAERHFAARLSAGLLLAPGAREFVERVHGRVRLALVTRAARREVELALALSGFDGAFECVVAAEDARHPKPCAAPYRRALERLGRRRSVRPERAVALEDGAPGICAAHAAGLRCVAVGPVPPHVAVQADAHLPSLVGMTPRRLAAVASPRAEAREEMVG